MFKIFKEDFLDLNEIQRLITNDKLPITNKENRRPFPIFELVISNS